ncbi:MAG TPA: hypothetical protein VEH01_01545 [Nitrososphaerales archaeon]|nr:hypothetical protein [Nitrososphaerales archaeon]
MRESSRIEKSHLPRDSGEEWLEHQEPRNTGTKHRRAPENVYELWLEKRIKGKRVNAVETRKRAQ